MPNPAHSIEISNLNIEYRRYLKQHYSAKDAFLNLFRGVHYDSFWALKDINLTISPGEVVGIIGPNGAGKSTLLRACAGILTPSKGKIRCWGRIAPVLELGSGFNPELTGRENIYLSGVIMGLSQKEIRSRIPNIIEFAEIGDFIDAPLTTYSTGMRARLGFAVATDIQPDILLLDEVLSVGDLRFREKARERIDALICSGRTVLMVTHGLELIKRYCTRSIYVRDGQLIADGDAKSVVDQYLAS